MAKTTICDTVAKMNIKIREKQCVFKDLNNHVFGSGFGACTRTVCDTVVHAQLQPYVSLRFWSFDTHRL